MTKIIGLASTCRDCPDRRYESGGVYHCGKVNLCLQANCEIPDWCPLPNYPAQAAQPEQVKPHVVLELPDGDSRTARVAYSELKGTDLHVCLVVSEQPAQVPAGYKLVPVEPTQEMCAAYLEASLIYWASGEEVTTEEAAAAGCRAAIAAAPEKIH